MNTTLLSVNLSLQSSKFSGKNLLRQLPQNHELLFNILVYVCIKEMLVGVFLNLT